MGIITEVRYEKDKAQRIKSVWLRCCDWARVKHLYLTMFRGLFLIGLAKFLLALSKTIKRTAQKIWSLSA